MTDAVEFTTTDLGVAAFLLAKGHALLRLGAAGGRRKVFCFPPGVRAVAATFYQDALVPARSFANAIRDLKAQVLAE